MKPTHLERLRLPCTARQRPAATPAAAAGPSVPLRLALQAQRLAVRLEQRGGGLPHKQLLDRVRAVGQVCGVYTQEAA